MDEYFTVDTPVDVREVGSGRIIGRLKPGKQYRSVGRDDEWIWVEGPGGITGAIRKFDAGRGPQTVNGVIGLDCDAETPAASWFDDFGPQVIELAPGEPRTDQAVVDAVHRNVPNASTFVIAHYDGPLLRAANRLGNGQVLRPMGAVAAAATALGWPGRPKPLSGVVLIAGSFRSGLVAGVAHLDDGVIEILSQVGRRCQRTPQNLKDVADAARTLAAVHNMDALGAFGDRRLVDGFIGIDATLPPPQVEFGALVPEGLALETAILRGAVGDTLVLDAIPAAIHVTIDGQGPVQVLPAGAALSNAATHNFTVDRPGPLTIELHEGDVPLGRVVLNAPQPGVWTCVLDIDANARATFSVFDPFGSVLTNHRLS